MSKMFRKAEWAFRHTLVYPILRLIWRNPRVDAPLDISRIRKILILRYDRIGDIVVTTPVFKALKKANPKIVVGVLASESNAELIRFNTNVDRIHILHSSWFALWREVLLARRMDYDVVLNFIFNRTTSGGVLANLIAPNGIKIGQGAEKYGFYFNMLLKLKRGELHMAELLASIVKEVLGVSILSKDLHFELPLEKQIVKKVDDILKSIAPNEKLLVRKQQRARSVAKSRLIVLNISATDSVRKISSVQASAVIRSILKQPACWVAVISAPQEFQRNENIVQQVQSDRCRSFPGSGTASLLEIAALIRRADAVVSPDTSIIHIASATDTPVLGLFTPLQETTEWLPYKVKHRTVFAMDGNPVSSIPTELIEREVAVFLRGIVK